MQLFETLLKELLPGQVEKNAMFEFHMLALLNVLNSIEQVVDVGGWYFNVDTKRLFWTNKTYQISGLPVGAPISVEQSFSFFPPKAKEQIEPAFNELVERGIPYTLELPFKDATGNSKWVRTSGSQFSARGFGKIIVGTMEDISLQKALSFDSTKSKISHESILNNIHDCIITINANGTIISTSKSVRTVFGYDEEEILGKSVNILMPEPHSRLHSNYMEMYQKTGKAKIIGVGRELPGLHKSGKTFPIELSLSDVIFENEQAYIGIVRDISERKEAEKQVHKLAYYDRLTDVFNMVSFARDLKKALFNADSLDKKYDILLIDIEKFSQLNLIYGRDIGDILLRLFSQRLQNHINGFGHVYRDSKDRFYCILDEGVSNRQGYQQSIESLIESIREHCISTPYEVADFLLDISVSIVGLSLQLKVNSIQETIDLLDIALNKVKDSDRNIGVVTIEDSQRSLLHKGILSAIETEQCIDEISVVFQPQFNKHGNIVSSEVLARWQSRTLGNIEPSIFIPIAEKSGLITKIGYIVFRKMAEAQSAVYRETGVIPKLAVNISSKQIAQPDFEIIIKTILDEFAIPYDRVCLEVTESVLITDLGLISDKMKNLHKQGFEFSIDDFGTGYSSLSYLKHMPIQELKIDKSFVDDVVDLTTEVPIVNAVISMGKAFGLRVVAEGVETITQRDYLLNCQCDVLQGFNFSTPLDFEAWKELDFV